METSRTQPMTVSSDFLFLTLLNNVGASIRDGYALHSSDTLRSKLIDKMPGFDVVSPSDVAEDIAG